MAAGTGFFVASVGDPRVFELGDEGRVLWSFALPDRSLVHVDVAMNARWKHRVPEMPGWVGCRCSLIFRTIV